MLSRQIAGMLNERVLLTLGQPKSIETLEGLRIKRQIKLLLMVFLHRFLIVLILNGPYIFTNDVCKSFRPKKAIKPRP